MRKALTCLVAAVALIQIFLAIRFYGFLTGDDVEVLLVGREGGQRGGEGGGPCREELAAVERVHGTWLPGGVRGSETSVAGAQANVNTLPCPAALAGSPAFPQSLSRPARRSPDDAVNPRRSDRSQHDPHVVARKRRSHHRWRIGDLWVIGEQKLLVGDARDTAAYERLLHGDLVQLIVTDPPYGCAIANNVRSPWSKRS